MNKTFKAVNFVVNRNVIANWVFPFGSLNNERSCVHVYSANVS